MVGYHFSDRGVERSGANACTVFGAVRVVSVSWFATATWRAVDV